ncbi:MAG: ribosomal protein L11 methyltransferase [Crocinitomicaceae bacterium]|jgi:ribosomal protein L11 methyltransferase
MDTLELKINISPKNPWSDILVAELSELGFDSFVDTEEGLLAYAPAEISLEDVLSKTSIAGDNDGAFSTSHQIIPHQNWNAKWESDFHPVFVEEYATILAPFHDEKVAKGMRVVIQPQMSFGTGHHQTTWMMTKALFELDLVPDAVLDMGTGTGVLAIVAENLGAKRILAIDIESWSAENAELNANSNGSQNIEVKCGDIDLVGDEQFGLIIANINKNILKAHMSNYASALIPNGTLLLSGFFDSDVEEMTAFAEQFGLKQTKVFGKDEWAAIQLSKIN